MVSVLDLKMSNEYVKRSDSVRNLQEPKQLTGLDDNRELVILMKELQVYDNVVLGYPCKLPFRDASFEIVLATNAVNPLNKREKRVLIEECKRIAIEKFYARFPYPSECVFVAYPKENKFEIVTI